MDPDVAKAIQPDGALYADSWYLSWTTDVMEACLDGLFSSVQLRDIADHMDKNGKVNALPKM